MTTLSSTIQSPSWSAAPSDEAEDVDEPPELRSRRVPVRPPFQKGTVRSSTDQPSLLTRAILSQSDEEAADDHTAIINDALRRRSMASNVSVASTADLTSDTGLTSPSRTNTPSPPMPEMAMLRLNAVDLTPKINQAIPTTEPKPAVAAPRKRCIQFACGAQAQPKPQLPPIIQAPPPPAVRTTSTQDAPRRPCIRFACQAKPASTQGTPSRISIAPSATSTKGTIEGSRKKPSSPVTAGPPSPRHGSAKRSQKPSTSRPKFLRANSVDLDRDGSQFHVFARERAREDDWIRQENPSVRAKLTINDTLSKENNFRRLAVEAEEEEMEEDDETTFNGASERKDSSHLVGDVDEEEDDDDEEDEEDDEEEDDDEDEDDDDDLDAIDGYSTDEETGFADSDDEDDEDENMILWTPSSKSTQRASTTPIARQLPVLDQQSDSSTSTGSSGRRGRSIKAERIRAQNRTPDLPDSTDFVCGTLDEDRPLEEAFLTSLALRRDKKLRVIPQDIDPSFPTSDPENEEEEELYNPVHHSSDEEQWMTGKMEDIHHEQRPSARRKKSEGTSPRRFRSPPPKRHRSPAPKPRVRSPKPLFERHSPPRRTRSPAPKAFTTPTVSPNNGPQTKYQLAGRPGPFHTKSLPRPAAFFTHQKVPKSSKHYHNTTSDDGHVRGAIDIVKGLEKKRQRRREKFHQKYVDRARRGQIPERKPMPGRGAERMKELGLLMAGKKDNGNYVLSI